MFFLVRIFLIVMQIIHKIKDLDTKKIISRIIINFYFKKKMVKKKIQKFYIFIIL